MYSVDLLNKGTIQILAGTQQDSERFYCTTQNSAQFTTHKLFISGIVSNRFAPWLARDN